MVIQMVIKSKYEPEDLLLLSDSMEPLGLLSTYVGSALPMDKTLQDWTDLIYVWFVSFFKSSNLWYIYIIFKYTFAWQLAWWQYKLQQKTHFDVLIHILWLTVTTF